MLLTRIRREKAILDDPSIKVGSVNAAFYEMYASEIRQQLGWAEDELSKDEYNIDVAKRAFAKIASLKTSLEQIAPCSKTY